MEKKDLGIMVSIMSSNNYAFLQNENWLIVCVMKTCSKKSQILQKKPKAPF